MKNATSYEHFAPTSQQLDDVKRDLPPVRVRFGGQLYWGRVTGRKNQFASVSPYQPIDNRKLVKTIIGPVEQFSWTAVCRAVVNGTELEFGY